MAFATDFNANDPNIPEDNRSFDLLPNGWQPAHIIEAEVRRTKAGTGELLALTWEILDGPFAKRRVWQNINILNQSQQAQEIGQIQFKALCQAVGIPGVRRGDDPMTVFGYKPCSIMIGRDQNRETGEVRNAVKQTKPYGHTGSEAPARPSPAPARPGPAPSRQTPPARPAQAAAAARPVGRPWGRLDDEIPF